jgi:hypothetical protein
MADKKRDNLVPTTSFTMRLVDDKLMQNKSKKLKKQYSNYGKSVMLEFDNNGFAVFIASKKGLHFKLPKSFFEEQWKDDSEDLEITFTPKETMAIMDMWLLWEFGEDYKKVLKEKGWKI